MQSLMLLLMVPLVIYGFSVPRSVKSMRSSSILRAYDPGETWRRLVARKQIEVETLLRQVRETENHPYHVRMGYMADENTFNLTKAIKRFDIPDKGTYQALSVICDMKRRSPTIPGKREIVDFDDAGRFSGLLVKAGVDALIVNTNEVEYGGCVEDVAKVFKSVRANRPHKPCPIIAKDVIVHPVQIAQAVENGATAVLLISCILGEELVKLLNACTIQGIEALVEVHTKAEVRHALKHGANLFLVNRWNRLTGQFFPDQAKYLAREFPFFTARVVGGNINSVAEAIEHGYLGYDGVILGRAITELPDIKKYIDDLHYFRGHVNLAKHQQLPNGYGLGLGDEEMEEVEEVEEVETDNLSKEEGASDTSRSEEVAEKAEKVSTDDGDVLETVAVSRVVSDAAPDR